MAATACLYNLVKSDLSKMIHTGLLSRMVELLLHAIDVALEQQQVIMLNSHGCIMFESNLFMLVKALLIVMLFYGLDVKIQYDW